jgi:hypothetical protein
MDVQERRSFVNSVLMPACWHLTRARYEAWWEGQPLHQPLVRLTAPRAPTPPASPPSDEAALFDWYTDPLQVLPRLERSLASTFYAGDAFPWLDPMSQGLAAIQTAFHGAPYRIDPLTLTGWTDPLFHDWQNRPSFRVDPANRWWQATRLLLAEGARGSRGRYIVSIPDLQGGGEILALLRGSQELALDLIDCPEQIAPALQEINLAWYGYYQECFRIIHAEAGACAGYVDWIPLLQRIQAAGKAVVIACDPDEIPILLQALDPNHLVLTSTCASPQAALELLQAIDHPQGTCPERSEGTWI